MSTPMVMTSGPVIRSVTARLGADLSVDKTKSEMTSDILEAIGFDVFDGWLWIPRVIVTVS